jgi:hypothetical protein
MTYWCLTGCSGTSMPAMAPIWRAHWPPQLTTLSHSTTPCVVWTAVMRPSSVSKPVTRTPSTILAPCMRAPLASDWAMSEGLAWPSVGSQLAPTRSDTSISGHMRLTSSGETRCISMPKLCAVVASRRNSVQRSWLVASRRQPVIFQPVSSPVSAASCL